MMMVGLQNGGAGTLTDYKMIKLMKKKKMMMRTTMMMMMVMNEIKPEIVPFETWLIRREVQPGALDQLPRCP